MTKQEFIDKIKTDKRTPDGLSKKALGEIVDVVFGTLSDAIKKDKRFQFPSFGTFKVAKRKSRKGRNPQTGEEITIKASKTVTFKPAPTFKNKL